MWFTNLYLYRFTKPFTFSAKQVNNRLLKNAFQPCASLQPASYGWVPPLGRHGEQFIHEANGNILVCARKEEKILPAAVIRDIVNDKVAEIEENQARQVRRKEREAMRDEVMLDLLPKAFSRSNLTFAYVCPQDNLLVVNASSAKKSEELLTQLRSSLGTLPVIAPVLKKSPATLMTRWLNQNKVPTDFIIGDECELRDPSDEGAIIRCKHQDLTADEIQTHLSAGKQVVKLTITWKDCLSCLISEDLTIKRLRFSDEILEQSHEIDAADVVARFDTEFSLMTLELAQFIPSLLNAFGGEDNSAYHASP